MGTEIVKANGQTALAPLSLSKQEIELLQNTVCDKHTPAQCIAFVSYCRAKGADPFGREIYSIIRKGRQTFQLGIDMLRKRAEETGLYEGQTPAYWCGADGQWTDIWLKKEPPAAAKVGVYKRGLREPMWAVAKYEEYKPAPGTDGDGDWMWKKMPSNQLAKCCEALALRKAFPSQLGGLYAHEEMAQADSGKATVEATHARAETLAARIVQNISAPPHAVIDAAPDEGSGEPAPENPEAEPLTPAAEVKTITPKQRERFWAIARASGWQKPEVEALLRKHGLDSSTKIPASLYDAFVITLENGTGKVPDHQEADC